MKRFLIVLFFVFIVEVVVVEFTNIIMDMQMTPFFVVANALFVSLLGVGVARGIQYAIKAAKDHEA